MPAGGGDASGDQDGSGNFSGATVIQDGSNKRSGIDQNAVNSPILAALLENQSATVTQDGADNTRRLNQYGRDQIASITQIGEGKTSGEPGGAVGIAQVGDKGTSTLTQNGDNNDVIANQTEGGLMNESIITQTGNSNLADITQGATGNLSDVPQNDNNNSAVVIQN